MYLATLPIEDALGHILRHNLMDANGHKRFSKGHRLRHADLEPLRLLDIETVRVAILEAGDVSENEAARRLAEVVAGPGVLAMRPAASRVNLLAAYDGVAAIDTDALLQINGLDGLTVATVANHRLVRAHKRIATIKIIPFAVREEDLREAEEQARASTVIQLHPLRSLLIGVILIGGESSYTRLREEVFPAIEGRLQDLGSTVLHTHDLAADEQLISQSIRELREAGAELLVIAGETSIMDRDDVTPMGIRLAGGQIEHYGAPVEPGNLLLLAYLADQRGQFAILGAPGCVRSRSTNIVDLLLPRLLAGEHVTRRAIITLGHGGLLE